MKIKTFLVSIFCLFPLSSIANSLSLNQIATCFYTDIVIGDKMKKMGDMKSVKVYEETAIDWARAGMQKFGESPFKNAWQTIAPNINKMNDDQLIVTKKNCNNLIPKLYK